MGKVWLVIKRGIRRNLTRKNARKHQRWSASPSAFFSAGFSLVEVLLSVTILGLIVTALVGAFIFGRESTAISGQRARAIFLAEEGLEAARNIRDAGFGNLTTGTHGLAISGSQWNFSGSSDTTDIYTRQTTIASAGSNRQQVTTTVTWQQNPQRTGQVQVVTYLTNWKASSGGGAPPSSCASYCQSVGYSTGTCRENTVQCTINSETYESLGDSICVAGFPGDPSQDTCCCLP